MTGEVEAELKGHTAHVRSVAFSQDSSRVVSGSDDKTVRIWNTMTGEIEAEMKGHTGYVSSVAFSLDSSRVVSGSYDMTVRIWNTMTNNIEAVMKGHQDWVWSVAFSQDGSRIVSGARDMTVRIWNVMTGEVEAELNGLSRYVRTVAFSLDGTQVVFGSDFKTVQIWNTVTGEQLMITTTITLPDGSVVHNAGMGDFNISYLEQPTFSIQSPLSVSDDYQWIVGALHDCWVPSRNREIFRSTFFGDRVFFVYSSGNIIILDMKVDQ